VIGSDLLKRFRGWSTHRFLMRLHRVTHRLPLDLRPIAPARILVVAPHMDDAEIACGGTLVLHRRAGSTIGVLYTTDSGNTDGQKLPAEELRRLRKSEAERSAAELGAEILAVAQFPDGHLSLHEAAAAGFVAEWLRTWKPEQIFCPFPADNHRDHQATTAAVALGVEQAGWRGEVWCYEVWSPLWPNVAIDISKVQAEKARVIACYASQTNGMPYADAALGLNRFRGLRVGVEAAEAFHVSSAEGFRELCRPLFQV
jgi:N-acetylglucosamine malate deacetylase 1